MRQQSETVTVPRPKSDGQGQGLNPQGQYQKAFKHTARGEIKMHSSLRLTAWQDKNRNELNLITFAHIFIYY